MYIHCVLCRSPLVVPAVRGEVGHGYCHLFFVFPFLVFSQCVPTHSVFSCCSPFSSHSFQISLNAVLPSRFRSSSHPFPSTFWASDLFDIFSSPSPPTCPTHFNLHLSNFNKMIIFKGLFTVRKLL